MKRITKRNLIIKKIKAFVGNGTIVKENSLLSDHLGIDSMDKIDLWMELEDYFRVTIPEDEAKKMKSVKDVIKTIEKYTER